MNEFGCRCCKDGKGLIDVVDKQLSRIGCTVADLASAATDGGGENVGKEGLHALLQGLGTASVRRRGLEHLSWRVCDAGLSAAKSVADDYKLLSNYFHEGITWTRLQEVAVLSIDRGGLGIMVRSSAAFQRIFNQAPPNIIEDRPETDMLFLRSE